MSHDIWRLSATEIAGAIRRREFTCRETVEAHITRTDAVNPTVNAVVRTLNEEARRAAIEADRALDRGDAVGALHGVPITIKEGIDLAGSPTTLGVPSMKDAIAAEDAPVVAFMKQAGAIPIGRTNMPDIGLRWHTDSALHGPTLNPWDPNLTPGGSSGGEAAAIATGLSPLGIGNDIGGSVRYPAQCCGIASLKPSMGRVSRIATRLFDEPPMFHDQMALANGPMARRVADLRLALRIMEQSDPHDPCWCPAPRAARPVDGPRPRVGLTFLDSVDGCDPAIRTALHDAAGALADAGYPIETVEPPEIPASTDTVQALFDAEFDHYRDWITAIISDDARRFFDTGIVGVTDVTLSTYMKAIGARHRIARAWSVFMASFPLVLGPVSALPPFKVGEDLVGPAQTRRIARSMALVELCNLIGLPAVALSLPREAGIPQAVQIIGGRFQDDMCLDAAQVIEDRFGISAPVG